MPPDDRLAARLQHRKHQEEVRVRSPIADPKAEPSFAWKLGEEPVASA